MAATDNVKFHRFEAIARADRRLTLDCGDGTTAPLRVFVEGIYENEVEDGVVNADRHSIVSASRRTAAASSGPSAAG